MDRGASCVRTWCGGVDGPCSVLCVHLVLWSRRRGSRPRSGCDGCAPLSRRPPLLSPRPAPCRGMPAHARLVCKPHILELSLESMNDPSPSRVSSQYVMSSRKSSQYALGAGEH